MITRAWYDDPAICPLCRGGTAAQDIKGTDRRVCGNCADDIPSNMWVIA